MFAKLFLSAKCHNVHHLILTLKCALKPVSFLFAAKVAEPLRPEQLSTQPLPKLFLKGSAVLWVSLKGLEPQADPAFTLLMEMLKLE